MGRPRDEFVWEQVEALGNGTWKCKYCSEEFEGTASRRYKTGSSLYGSTIKQDHNSFSSLQASSSVGSMADEEENGTEEYPRSMLAQALNSSNGLCLNCSDDSFPGWGMAAQENGIEEDWNNLQMMSCLQAVNDFQPSTSQGDFNLGFSGSKSAGNHPSSSNDMRPDLVDKKAEDYVNGELLRFLLSPEKNSEFNDPKFMNLLKAVGQHGFPSMLLGNPYITERSLLNIKEEVSQNISMVQESWKTTGCTLMVFSLKVGEYVYGFYSSKGFFFVRADTWMYHWPRLDIKRVTHFMDHPKDKLFFLNQNCKFSNEERSNPINRIQSHLNHTTSSVPCLRHKIKGECIKSCQKSKWAWSLIEKAGEIHKLVSECYLCDWYRMSLATNQEFSQFISSGEHENPLSRFISIILLEDELKECVSYPLGSGVSLPQTQLKALIEVDSMFWDEGKELKRALTPILKIPHLLDTLVPSAGYLDIAIDKAKHAVYSDDRRPRKEDPLWGSIKECLDDYSMSGMRQPVAAYLNPVYFWNGDMYMNVDLKGIVRERLKGMVEVQQWNEMDKQLQRYSDVSSNPFSKFRLLPEHNHPVELWEKYGQGLPLLQKCAIQILSQPVSCMCNQVKNHMLHSALADDILRLNLWMMQVFTKLGNNNFKPIDLEELCKR